jgi:hypothetical protein
MRPQLDPSQTLRMVIHWQTGMVLAFDQDGKQIPALQGKHSEVWLDIARAATPETVFCLGIYPNGRQWEVSPGEWLVGLD